jgi:hypothetical protein
MKYIKKFETFSLDLFQEEAGGAEPAVRPGTKEPPVKPKSPTKPAKPITRPSTDPDPKAEAGKRKKKVTAEHVAHRFISELNKRGESVKKYLS